MNFGAMKKGLHNAGTLSTPMGCPRIHKIYFRKTKTKKAKKNSKFFFNSESVSSCSSNPSNHGE